VLLKLSTHLVYKTELKIAAKSAQKGENKCGCNMESCDPPEVSKH